MFRRIRLVVEGIVFLCAACVLVLYLIFPSPSFPKPLPDSVQSLETGDTETSLRRAYFTNYSREATINYYTQEFSANFFRNIPVPTIVLNYPPEDAFLLIRDQTRSTFLEEIVHPFRESLYINGFKPTLPKDAIGYRGVSYDQKITIKYVTSPLFVRVPLILVSMGFFWLVLHELLSGVYKILAE